MLIQSQYLLSPKPNYCLIKLPFNYFKNFVFDQHWPDASEVTLYVETLKADFPTGKQ